MNWIHRRICGSGWWRQRLTDDLTPWTLQHLSLGPRTLEIGPGPGLTTNLLRHLSDSLVCVEVDSGLARRLQKGVPGNNTRLLCGDGCQLPLASQCFDSVVAFTMLHHVEPATAQDALFREAARVLRPGGMFIGTDSVDNPLFRVLHWGDTMQLVDPNTLAERLQHAGFVDAEVERRRYEFRFRAKKADVT